jgi:hypothetical protein
VQYNFCAASSEPLLQNGHVRGSMRGQRLARHSLLARVAQK